ncbi:MAG: ECF transporter S component [Eubacterium sp.]|nr:ECF transporter S component [Eubacterium sp.]
MYGSKSILVDNYYLISLLIIAAGIVITALYYRRRMNARELVLITSLSALIAISRGVMAWAPEVKPVSALVITIASIFGPVPGMIIGALSAFLSNFLIGQGPWTPFQIIAWALMGYIGGFLDTDNKYKPMLVSIPLVLGVYSVSVNIASAILITGSFTWDSFVAMEISGFPLDCVHTGFTVILLYFIWNPLRKKLMRMRTKYGILRR